MSENIERLDDDQILELFTRASHSIAALERTVETQAQQLNAAIETINKQADAIVASQNAIEELDAARVQLSSAVFFMLAIHLDAFENAGEDFEPYALSCRSLQAEVDPLRFGVIYGVNPVTAEDLTEEELEVYKRNFTWVTDKLKALRDKHEREGRTLPGIDPSV